MGKLDSFKTAAELANMAVNAAIAITDARRRQREEEEKRKADEKDKRIKELETENERLKAAATPKADPCAS